MKQYLISLSIFILIHLSAFSQSGSIIQERKVYKIIDGKELSADIFYVDTTKNKPNNPAIVFFHGGGWVFGSPYEFHTTCQRFARKGFVTISFQYRLSVNDDGSYPNPDITPIESMKDARTAVRWVRENARSLNIDEDKIVVAGQSAGGQLALSTALMDNINEETDDLNISPCPNAILLYSGAVNMIEAWAEMLMGEKREQIWSISPFHHLKKDMPPTIAFHGEKDCQVPFWVIELYKKKMLELDNDYTLISFKERKHYLGEGNEVYAHYFDEEIMEMTDEFLIRQGSMGL